MGRTLILVPVFNEETTLPRVLVEVRQAAPDAEVLVVDDGSTDRSPHTLAGRRDIRVIRHEENLGYGQSLITGFTEGIARGYDVVVTIDCDEQHEPQRIPAFRDAVGRSDIVSGSRYLDPSIPGDPAPHDRMQLNREFTALLRAVTGYEITDAWCGFKAYRVEGLRRLHLTEPSYGMPLQVWVQSAFYRLTVAELPVARIYKNPERQFWGGLDDMETRRAYYMRVLEEEVKRWLPDRLPLLKAAAR